MKKDLEAAFARPHSEDKDFIHLAQAGMTLRDYFAAKAMQSMLQSDSCPYSPATEVPKASYLIADAMMKAREA
jgi:hypothetical protein